MATTSIEWTATVNPDGSVTPGKVWNPVTGCHKVSPGCKHCYAEGVAKRFWKTQYPPVDTRPREFGDVQTHVDRLTAPFSWKKPYKVFVNSMSDLFEESVPFEFIDQAFAVMALCPHITFIVLTKRAERMREYIKGATIERIGAAVPVAEWPVSKHEGETRITGNPPAAAEMYRTTRKAWPLPNVWLLVSVENQKYADERIPILLDTPAAVRGISYEPALGPVELTYNQMCGAMGWGPPSPPRRANTPPDVIAADLIQQSRWVLGPTRISWVIVGGESGPGARPFDVTWARSIVKQCAAAGAACFVKQFGSRPFGGDVLCQFRSHEEWVSKARSWLGGISGGGLKYKKQERAVCVDAKGRVCLSGREFRIAHEEGAFPVTVFAELVLGDRKGGNMSEWPEDLRVRQFPEARV